MKKYYKINPLIGYIFEEVETNHPFLNTFNKVSVKLNLIDMGNDFQIGLLKDSYPFQYWLQTQNIKEIIEISFDEFLTILQNNNISFSFYINNADVKAAISKKLNNKNMEYNKMLPKNTSDAFFRKVDFTPDDFHFVITSHTVDDVLNFVKEFENGSQVTSEDIFCSRYELDGSFVKYNLTKDG